MKYVQINTCPNGSTGRIMMEKHHQLLADGVDSYVFWGRNGKSQSDREICFASDLGVYNHVVMTRLTDRVGCYSKSDTKRLIGYLEDIDPDVLHLHNLHGYYLNIEMLFNWIKSKPNLKVYWTLHDCWAFTGHCAYFSYIGCDKWKTQCFDCPQKDTYPKSLRDNSRCNFKFKKELFTGVEDMTLIVPSNWLKDKVMDSFLKEYEVEVVYNKINTDIFKPTTSDFRSKYNLANKFIILGVANPWSDRKGFNDFIELSHLLDDRYMIVLVGLSDKQIAELPDNILGLEPTDSAEELAGIYSAADLYFNASKEETFGLTTIEAMSCGTLPLVYQGTACEEVVNVYGGVAIDQDVTKVYEFVTDINQ